MGMAVAYNPCGWCPYKESGERCGMCELTFRRKEWISVEEWLPEDNQMCLVPGNWIEREQTRAKVKWAIDDIDVLDKKNVVTCHGAQLVRKEDCDLYKDLKDRTKERIAVALGKCLLERGLISFFETKERYNTIKIEGVVTVIREEKGGAE